MDKKEFLNILKQSLEGEVDNRVLEQSISFYNEYISSQPGKSEEKVINEIGDPRLIAKTIIDTENAKRGETGSNYRSSYDNSGYDNRSYDNTGDDRWSSNYNKVYKIKWYHMILIAVILIFLFAFLIRIGWMLLRLFFVFFVPIIFMVLLWTLFRKR